MTIKSLGMSNDLWVILVSSLIAISCSMIGTFLLLRRMAMLSDAISHAILPGIVIAFLLSGEMDYGTFLIWSVGTAIFATFLIEFLSRITRFHRDISMGIVYTLMFSIGIILLSYYQDSIPLKSDHVIMGNLEFVPIDLWIVDETYSLGPYPFWSSAINLLIVGAFISIAFRGLTITSFDSSFASVSGIRTRAWNNVFLVITSITVVISFDSIGAILVIGFIVIPSAAALIFTRKLRHTLLFASGFGVLACILGFYCARWLNTSIAGSMCSVMGTMFLISFLIDKFVFSNKRLA